MYLKFVNQMSYRQKVVEVCEVTFSEVKYIYGDVVQTVFDKNGVEIDSISRKGPWQSVYLMNDLGKTVDSHKAAFGGTDSVNC